MPRISGVRVAVPHLRFVDERRHFAVRNVAARLLRPVRVDFNALSVEARLTWVCSSCLTRARSSRKRACARPARKAGAVPQILVARHAGRGSDRDDKIGLIRWG